MMINETERQVLIALIEMSDPIETPNNTHYTFYPKTLEEAASYFRSLREDWSSAYCSLAGNRLLQTGEQGYSLTEAGAALARQERLDHPPIWYWYREYYSMTAHSRAYSLFCEKLYGRDLCQTNFSDMEQIDFLVQKSDLAPEKRALDLGCGKGLFAEYLADRTGASVWGVDYIPEAVEQALERTRDRHPQLHFQVANLDHLNFPENSFDLLTSIDTLYMPNDLPSTLLKMQSMLAPGGKMLIYYSQFCFGSDSTREFLLPDGTDLARALQQVGLSYQTWDFSESTFYLMRCKHKLALEMLPQFEAEGTRFLYDHLVMESDSSEGPYDPARLAISRYLYQVGPKAKA